MEKVILGKNGCRVKKLNRREAGHEKCLNCSAWVPSDVKNCPFVECPLYPYRTGQGLQDAKARLKAMRKRCLYCMNGQVGEVAKCTCKNCPLFPYRKGGLEKAIIPPADDKIAHIEETFLFKKAKLNRRPAVNHSFGEAVSI